MAIIYGRNGRDVVLQLSQQLEVPRYRFYSGRWHGRRPNNLHIAIRWGAAGGEINAGVVYNRASSIALASNKPAARRAMADAGVAVPAPSETPPCVGRPMQHRAGQGFWFCQTADEVERAKQEGAVYFSQFYPKTREHRVHVAHGAVLLVQEKRPRDGMEGLRELPIWNHAVNDFVFQAVPQNNWPLTVIRTAIAANEALHLDFGGVDVMSKPTDQALPYAVVCEVNTAPSVADYALSKYVEYFRWLMDQPRDHFTCSGSRRADYVFSNLIGGR